MKILELFCGTKSFSKIAKRRGHEILTVDNDPQHNADITKDILEVTSQDILDKFGQVDVVWASPPCTTFSVASIYRYWENGKPKNEKTLLGIRIVQKTIQLIQELQPKFWIIENPRGMLRKQDFMQSLPRSTVTYCQYGHKVQKPTDLWNNISSWKPKAMCKPGSSCHERSSRGAKRGLQGIYNKEGEAARGRSSIKRAIVPEELCTEILVECEKREAEGTK